MCPPPDSRFPLDLKKPLWREIPIYRAFLNIISRVPSKGALPPSSLHRTPIEKMPYLQSPFSAISQSPQ
jgi:hypothetical protein